MIPKTYWEERCNVADGALERVVSVLCRHFPSMSPELSSIKSEWFRIVGILDEEYKVKEES